MARAVHTFDNGVRIFDDLLWPGQRVRYEKRNVHEAEEEDIFVELIRRLPPDGVYVDIGAAIGYYLILARKLSPGLTIHGVEPLPRHRQILREHLALNGQSEDRFVLHEEGITASNGHQTLLDRGYSSRFSASDQRPTISLSQRWKSFLAALGLRRPKDPVVSVRTLTLDDLVRRIGGRIDLLQMDVQGLEVEVLRGGRESMRRGAIEKFLIGTHGRMAGLTLHQQCRDLLQAHGYRIEIDLPDTKEQPDGILVASR